MCHVIKQSCTSWMDDWLTGWKWVMKNEIGITSPWYKKHPYAVVQLDNGFLLHDTCFEYHEAMQEVNGTRGIRFYVRPGLYAWLKRRSGRGIEGERVAVAACPDWLSFMSSDSFSAHTLLCAADKRQLAALTGEYKSKMQDVWRFEWRVLRSLREAKTPIVGQGASWVEATMRTMEALAWWRPLALWESASLYELPPRRSTLKKGKSKWWILELRSPLWMT